MTVDFIGVGPGRSGTAWMHNCLGEHPQLCLPFKIINYFNDDENLGRGAEWYESRFRTCRTGQLRGELSLYLHSPEAPRRIYEYNPKVKLLIPLRNPVDRAFAAYQGELGAGAIPPTMSFAEALKQRPLYTERGFYHEALKRYLDLFSSEQTLVTIHDEGVADPEGFMRRIFEFLEVDPDFTPSMLRVWVSVGGVPRSAALTHSMNGLARQMRRMGLQKLMWMIKRSGAVGAVHSANRKSRAAEISPEEREELAGVFEADIQAVEEVLRRDLSGWRNPPVPAG